MKSRNIIGISSSGCDISYRFLVFGTGVLRCDRLFIINKR